MAGVTWLAVDQVIEGSLCVDPWARKGFMNELELVKKCVIKPKHQPGLVWISALTILTEQVIYRLSFLGGFFFSFLSVK